MPITYLEEPKRKITYLDEEQPREKQPTLSQNIASTVAKGMPLGNVFLQNLLPEKEKEMVRTEIMSPIASGVSTAAYGVPKALSEALGLKEQLFPEQKTIPGKIARFGTETAGFIGGGAVKTAGKLAEKLLPKTATDLLRKKVLRGAIKYGIAGTMQTPEQGIRKPIATIPQRALSGAVGTVLGAGGEAIGGGISKIKEIRAAKKSIPGILEKQKVLKGEQVGLSQQKKATIEQTQEYINKLKGKQETAAQYEVRGLKKEVPKLSSDFSKSYGNRLKDVSSKIDEQGVFNRDVAKDILQKSKDEMVAEGITPSESFNNLYEEFAGGGISKETQPELAALAKAVKVKNLKDAGINLSRIDYAKSGIKPQAEIPFTFRDFLNKLKEVKKGAYTGTKAATQIRTEDDISHIIVQKHLGEFAKEYAPDFLKLQEQASPAIQNIKYAKKLVKPGAPEIPAGAVSAIKKPDIAEADLIKMIQEGIPDFGVKGRGQLTASSAEKGLRMGQAQKSQDRIIASLSQKGIKLSGREKLLAEALKTAEDKTGATLGKEFKGTGKYILRRLLMKAIWQVL